MKSKKLFSRDSKQDREVISILDSIEKRQCAVAPPADSSYNEKVIRDAIHQLDRGKEAYVFYRYQLEAIVKVYPTLQYVDVGNEIFRIWRD